MINTDEYDIKTRKNMLFAVELNPANCPLKDKQHHHSSNTDFHYIKKYVKC